MQRRPLTPGAQIARYRLVREIGAGAMGSVWEAVDEAGGRLAIKVLRPEFDLDASIRRRFRREAAVLQAIEHPAVVRVIDSGSAFGTPSYLAMELLHGDTLESELTQGALDPMQAIEIAKELCSALSAVHRQGVLHGDVKPANVFLTDAGVRLVDFGLSKIEGLERLTRTGELSGTPLYMAPELLIGAAELDGRLDQYALGVVLYIALAGASPFPRKLHPGALMSEIVRGRSKPLREVCPSLSTALIEVVERAMQVSRDRRFPHMEAMGEALREIAK